MTDFIEDVYDDDAGPQLFDVSQIDRILGVIGREQRNCGRHGDYESVGTKRGEAEERWSGCPQCAEEARQREFMEERAREAKAREEKRLQALLGRAAIPPRFAGITFDSYAVADANARQAHNLSVCRAYGENFPEHFTEGRGLVLMGNKGTGKTHLAAAIAHTVIHTHGMSAVYTLATRMFRRLKDTFGSKDETESEVLRAYVSPDLLIIDEIGMGYCSPTELGFLFEVVNERYEHRRPTLIITNISDPAELETWVGERTMDRLRENGKALLFDWESRRRKDATIK